MIMQQQNTPEFDPISAKIANERSICIKNVDYKTTKEELEHLFSSFGTVVRVTLKSGYAYLEFLDKSMVEPALMRMQNFNLHGRAITVEHKRDNVMGLGRGRGRGRGRIRRGMMGGMPHIMYIPVPMGTYPYRGGRGAYRGQIGSIGRGIASYPPIGSVTPMMAQPPQSYLGVGTGY